jgi:hypothetical protein
MILLSFDRISEIRPKHVHGFFFSLVFEKPIISGEKLEKYRKSTKPALQRKMKSYTTGKFLSFCPYTKNTKSADPLE